MKLEVWSDIVCPWCYIGKRRMETALDTLGIDAEITWRSFELDSNAPARIATPLDEALAKKYRFPVEQARAMMDKVTNAAADEGLAFDFSIAQTGNTFDAHRLIHFAESVGIQDAMKERLLKAYFCEGKSVSTRDELLALAVEAGLPESDSAAVLDGDAFAQAVRDDQLKARQSGVTGVPFFVIDGTYAVSGAQPSDTLVKVFEQVLAKQKAEAELSTLGTAGVVCDDTGCEIPPA